MGKLTAPAIATHKTRDGKDPLVMVTAYDAPGARMASEAGADLMLRRVPQPAGWGERSNR